MDQPVTELHGVTVEFTSTDPKMVELLDAIRELRGAERLECEAHLYLALARSAWRDADRLRALDRKRRPLP